MEVRIPGNVGCELPIQVPQAGGKVNSRQGDGYVAYDTARSCSARHLWVRGGCMARHADTSNAPREVHVPVSLGRELLAGLPEARDRQITERPLGRSKNIFKTKTCDKQVKIISF